MREARPGVVKRWLYSLILLGMSLLFVFGFCELILRALGHRGAPHLLMSNLYFVDDPVLDWRRNPNSEQVEGSITYRYNSAGFRDVDHRIGQATGKFRIVVVGDSVTEGYGVESESFFTPYIQSSLGHQYEVINVSAGGLNSPQQIRLFETAGLRYEPELVVLNFVLNDFGFYSSLEKGRRYAEKKESRIDLIGLRVNPEVKRVLKSSALLYFLKQRLENVVGRIKGVPGTDHFTQLWQNEENQRMVISSFERLAVLQMERGFQVVVVIWPLLTDYERYPFSPVHSWVKQQAARLGWSTIDLLPDFSRFSYKQLQIAVEDHTHPNPKGHLIAAQAFISWFEDHRIRPAFRVSGDSRK